MGLDGLVGLAPTIVSGVRRLIGRDRGRPDHDRPAL